MSDRGNAERDKQMNTKKYMIIIKGEIKTPEIISCGYNTDTKKWDVQFRNGKTYSYAYTNVEWLKEPTVLNPNIYRMAVVRKLWRC